MERLAGNWPILPYIYIYIYIHIYIYIYIHTHTHTHTHIKKQALTPFKAYWRITIYTQTKHHTVKIFSPLINKSLHSVLGGGTPKVMPILLSHSITLEADVVGIAVECFGK